MSQATTWSVPLSGPATPDAFAARIDDSLDAILSSHSGSTRPTYAVAGTVWASNAIAGFLLYYLYDGTNDVLIGTVNTATGAFTRANTQFASKSGNYTAVAGDNEATLRFTAAATLSLPAASVAGSGWKISVIAGSGNVTIDPNGSETINGVASIIVPFGSTATVVCDGSTFFTAMSPFGWEVVPGGRVAQSGASAVNFTDLGAYRSLWIFGSAAGVTPAAVYVQTSTNNGSSYDQGASDYTHQYIQGSSTSVVGVRANASAAAITANATDGLQFSTIITAFNATQGCSMNTVAQLATGGTIVLETTTAARTNATARNAFRLITGAATLTCDVTVLGLKG